jgi:hypothetical protein
MSGEVMVKPGEKAKEGARFIFGDGLLTAEVLKTVEGGTGWCACIMRVPIFIRFWSRLEKCLCLLI